MLAIDKQLTKQLAKQAQCLTVTQGGIVPTRVQLQQTANAYVAEFYTPTLEYENYGVEIQNGQLVVFTHNELTHSEDGMVFPMFMGVYPILPHVDAQRIEAIFEDGVLRVIAPFREGIRNINKKIQIKKADNNH
ncbi:MAG: hypothetical protein KatS3mg033_1255 [Thermonema sp.]|jgi:HSP20 family molecular chaperone IbpA|uniref:Hsp20/alpha crystallin family protein n=1 Tax=Thermonema TaxID=28194 RepID=UPI000570CFAB|nr:MULTISPECIES: Hsp20/alpha crystallin family protein [Thermonema]GIV39455.1 MAG: hypothetical protein KatS3mg033_1255 [Thermonema sp.]